ncbi:MAG: transcriptional regulator [Candidatus Krumholzibacteriota bacterium]|nr:transcriptional regulator [Candidatus Krumholzibacteriota bacterium]
MNNDDGLIDAFCSITDPREMERFFGEIFTPAEIDDLVLRWRLMRLLHRKTPQRRIAGELGVSLCKITRGSRVLRKKNAISRKLLEKTQGVNDERRTHRRKPSRP